MLGAAGAAEALICIKAIDEGIVPPTINTTHLDPGMPPALNVVLGQALRKDIGVALSNTFGFGGHNASAVFRKLRD
jgi:3-oxoacyl-[acyl-carrier-protein] synthase II